MYIIYPWYEVQVYNKQSPPPAARVADKDQRRSSQVKPEYCFRIRGVITKQAGEPEQTGFTAAGTNRQGPAQGSIANTLAT